MTARTPKALAIGALVLLAAPCAFAEALPVAGESTGMWRYSLTPYLFLPGRTKGTSVVDDQSVDLELDLDEVLELLQGAASLRFEAWNGDWGIVSDLYYVYLEADESAELPGLAGSRLEVTSTTRQGWLSLMGAYRFARGTNAKGQRYAADASAGLRWNTLEQTVEYEVNGPPGSGIRKGDKLGGTETWLEPVVGVRGALEIADRWTVGARAELGGFGVNGNDLQYLVVAGVDWRAWERTSIKLGYQWYGIDFSTDRSDGAFTYDIDQKGLYAGITFRF